MKRNALLSSISLLAHLTLTTAQTLNIVAHQDDDVLFLNPDVQEDIHAGRRIRTIYVSAGDAGNDEDYWRNRQEGSRAAYAQMAGLNNAWSVADAGQPDVDIDVWTLNDNGDISLAFINLPDGNLNGDGFPSTGGRSIKQLWQGDINEISTVDGRSTYTSDRLLSTITGLINDFGPDRINTQDFVHDYAGDSDHSDHHTTAYYVERAVQSYGGDAQLVGYLGYGVNDWPVNLRSAEVEQKRTTFYIYGAHDTGTCHDQPSCASRPEDGWLQRQYRIAEDPCEMDLARFASASASSQNTVTGQTADKAIDWLIGGYPADTQHEWATDGQREGSWLTLTWDSPQAQVTEVRLYDRPNPDDHITSGVLEFDDGDRIEIGELDNTGGPQSYDFEPKTISSLTLRITGVSGSTVNAGLSEIRVMGPRDVCVTGSW